MMSGSLRHFNLKRLGALVLNKPFQASPNMLKNVNKIRRPLIRSKVAVSIASKQSKA